MAHDSVSLPVRKDELLSLTPNGETKLEECLYALSGRWVFVLIADGNYRLYLDPCGSQAAVYCPSLQIAAATTALIPQTAETGYDDELVNLMDIPNKDRWFPFGLTPRKSCLRLVPNHYLDLQTWTTHRHWPTGNLTANPNTREAATIVANDVKRLIRATVADRRVYCSLTAGQDTRMFLACAGKEREQIHFHTREDYSWSAERDLYVAKYIARRFRLNYQVVQRATTSDAELAAWLERTGRCVAGNAWRSARMIESFREESFILTGIAGGIARAYYWREGDTPETKVTVPLLIGRTKLPLDHHIQEAGEKWLTGLPFSDALLTLDLFCLEQRVACYSSPSRYGYTSAAVMMYPLAQRASIEAMLRLPAAYKRQEQLHKDIIAQEWPELLSIPINQDFGWPRIKKQAQKVFPFLRN